MLSKKILEALEHYKCQACGKVNPGLVSKELQVVTYRFIAKRDHWNDNEKLNPLDENLDLDAEDLCPSDVRCDACDAFVLSNGKAVRLLDAEAWMKDLGTRWAEQKQQQAKLKNKLQLMMDEDLPPVGTIDALEEQIKNMDFIS